MKRLISIFIVFIVVIFSITACTGDPVSSDDEADDKTYDEVLPDSGDYSQKGETGSLLSSGYADIINSGRYFLRYKGTINSGSITSDAVVTFAADGDKSSAIMEFSGMKTRVITINKKAYVLDDENKTYFINPVYDANDDPMLVPGNMKYLGSGNEIINGKNLVYEEYSSISGEFRYYFDGSKLYGMSSKNQNTNVFIEILEFSGNVSDDMFRIPSDYKLAY
ncbi:MAG: hypothetical protein WBH44_05220 [Proteocatella sp.]